jgi:hypothetical protein
MPLHGNQIAQNWVAICIQGGYIVLPGGPNRSTACEVKVACMAAVQQIANGQASSMAKSPDPFLLARNSVGVFP